MHHTLKTRILAMLLAFVMVMALPMPAFATEADAEPAVAAAAGDFGSPEIVYTEREDDYYNVISKKDYILAPGITESEIVLNNDAGSHRQVTHVVEVDINNPYTKVIPSTYKMSEGLENKDYKVQIMSQQAAYAEANGYGNVVAAMNIALSWYDSAYYKSHPELVGEPLGYLVLDGKLYKNSQGQTSGAQTVLVINFDEKDGVARPADMPKTQIRSTKDAITGWEEQVIPANFGFLVKDGKNQYSKNHSSDPASRSFMGIKEDGSIIIVMNDGRQAPFSTGFNSYEMAEFMLSLGCVHAVNGDGGGSSAFLSQRPGEDLKVNCAPSDGAERDTTHGILVISTAPATGEFNRATISSSDDYYTPGSEVQFSAIGTDLVGTSAEIPADVIWQLADDSFGTIDQDGLFVSNGTLGEVVVQMVYEGAVVGEDSIHIVMPDTIVFGQENMVVPYGKTVTLDISASYDSKPVVLKASDVVFALSDNGIGTISGFEFTAAEEGAAVTDAVLSATVGELTITANISLGKGSEIIYDFEDQDLTGWSIYTNYGKYGPKGPNGKVTDDNGNYWYHGQNERGYISIVDESTGMVRNGQYALAVECDFTQIFETGYQALNLKFPSIDCTDSVAIGFWLYIPYDARHAQMIIGARDIDNGMMFDFAEGWHYITAQAKDNVFSYINISVDDRAPNANANNYSHITEANLNGKYTFYIDDITVDYSTAVDDRENPVFGTPVVLSATGESSSALAGQTIDYNTVTFEAPVAENTTKTNAVGLDASSAKAYIDGLAMDCTFAGGKISVPSLVLADGIHTVKFEIADKNGNTAWVGGDINVQAGTDASTVKVVPQNPEADRILIGSLYWMDVVATDIETIDKVEMVFDLNNASSWELEGMEVAAGFTAEWSIQADDNIATITITRTGKNDATGEAVLASFPVRTWVSTTTQYEGYEHMDPAWLVDYGCVWKKSIELDMQRGVITYVPDYVSATTGTFGMEDLLVETELFFTNYTRGSVAGAQAWLDEHRAAKTGWHEHTIEAVADKAATCTEAGYTGRTYCAVCDSVVDWGTIVPAGGHSVSGEDGLNICGDCGLAFYYVDGEKQTGWIEEEGYYYYCDMDGVAVNDTATIDGHTYLFVDYVLTDGSWEHDGVGLTCWWAGELLSGPSYDTHWKIINGKTYYFNNIYVNVGVAKIQTSRSGGVWYNLFDDNGVFQSSFVGIYDDYYFVNGVMQKACLLFKIDDDFYFLNDGNKIAKNTKLYLSEKFVAGVTLSDGTAFPAGLYHFGADGKITNPPAVIDKSLNGIIGDYYYINGIKQKACLLFEIDGDFYFLNDGDKVARNTKLYLSEKFVAGVTLSDGTAFPAGLYHFGADGKITNPPAVIDKSLNGIIGDYYYINGIKQKACLLFEIDGDFYFLNDGDKVARDTKLYLSEKFVAGVTLSDGTAFPAGLYHFGADGKITNPPAVIDKSLNGIIGDYYYINGIKQKACLLFEIDGDFYFLNDGDKIAKNTKLYLSEKFVAGVTLSDGTAFPAGLYHFGADGKITNPPAVIDKSLNGIIGDYYYINGIKQKACLLFEIDGDFYFLNDGDKIAKNTKLYLSERFVAGVTLPDGTPFPAGLYHFDAEGKITNLPG